MRIDHASRESVQDIVKIHIASFPDAFLTSLGPRFLNWYYSSTINEETGICLAAYDTEMLGFVAGSTNPADHYSSILSRIFKLLPLAVSIGLTSPRSLRPAIQRFRWLSNERQVLRPADSELASIATSPDRQSRGVGKALVRAFAAEVRRRGLNSISLTTDLEANERVRSFYDSLGFAEAAHFDRDRPMIQYIATADSLL